MPEPLSIKRRIDLSGIMASIHGTRTPHRGISPLYEEFKRKKWGTQYVRFFIAAYLTAGHSLWNTTAEGPSPSVQPGQHIYIIFIYV
jgi:hypothetical protein